MIDRESIRLAVRKRIIACTNANPETQIQVERNVFDPSGLDFYIQESLIAGKERPVTAKRSRIAMFLVQYDIRIPIDSDSEILQELENRIVNEFDFSDPEKSSVNVSGHSINFIELKIEPKKEKDYQRKMFVFAFDVMSG